MVTHVACTNRQCPSYGIEKTVVSAMVLGVNERVCPQCGGPMKVARQINTSTKRSIKRSQSRKYTRKYSRKSGRK